MSTINQSEDLEMPGVSMEILVKNNGESEMIASGNKVAMVGTDSNKAQLDSEKQLDILKEIRRKKQETQIIFYDYITDQKEKLAIQILTTPFMDFEKLTDIEQAIEKHVKVKKQITRSQSKEI